MTNSDPVDCDSVTGAEGINHRIVKSDGGSSERVLKSHFKQLSKLFHSVGSAYPSTETPVGRERSWTVTFPDFTGKVVAISSSFGTPCSELSNSVAASKTAIPSESQRSPIITPT